jgi:2-phosphosulfolactate phosphatase
MEIRIESLLDGARRAEGTVVIIDVYRAFTTAAVASSRGAEEIIMVAEVTEALELRRRGVGDLCMGEVHGIKAAGFDFGNSPYELSQADVKGRTLIQSTRAGTSGAVAATKAETLYGAALANAAATAQAILRARPRLVTLVAMGWEGGVRTDEDELCALYIRNLLQGRQPDREAVRKLVLCGAESQKFGDPSQPHFAPQDRDIALQVDSIPVAIHIVREKGLLVARAEPTS